jgi:ribonucleoside-diphosphate reductase alpha chain
MASTAGHTADDTAKTAGECLAGLRAGVWSESAMRVLRERYLARNAAGESETPEDMCWRVAYAIALAEKHWGASDVVVAAWAQRFYDDMVDRRFLPNSPTLMNAGRGTGLQYSACYVLPIGDSMVEIFEAIKRAAIIHQSGGGTGFSFSRLRPRDSIVRSSGGRASGPVSFLRVFNQATEAVKQGGNRRGANMGILRVDHPDILEFIECKLDGGIANFNISVAVTDKYMQALADDVEYDLVAPHTGQVVNHLRARAVFQRIVEAAWRTGDPGLVFIDRINRSPANPTPELGEIEATNPCGEQPLLPNEACNLGSLNLARFALPGQHAGKTTNGDLAVDWKALEQTIRTAVRFLDNVIDVNPYPLPEIDQAVKSNRRIGLGVMGWADLLFKLGIPYDSEDAVAVAERLMSFINSVGHEADHALAEERGAFPNWPRSIYRQGKPRRNATVTTIAPTGTISIIADASSGIEPLFALAFSHTVEERRLTFLNPVFEQAARERGFWSEDLMAEVAALGTVTGVAGVPDDVQRVFVTAHEVAPEWHVRTQAAFQRHTDNGVSKTINLPNSASVDDVAAAYRLAYDVGCMGITVYRDGCKSEQVLHVGTSSAAEGKATADKPKQKERSGLGRKPRPSALRGATYRKVTPLGTAYITINEDEGGDPFELFVTVGKAGSDTAALAEAMGRLISLCMRLPSEMNERERLAEVVDQLVGIGGAHQMGFGKQRVRSLPDGLAQVLAEYLGIARDHDKVAEQPSLPLVNQGFAADLCPSCGQATFVYAEGCQKCYTCGHSEC